MSAYQYQALTASGKLSKGMLEADSLRAARQQLRDKGLIPVEVGELSRTQKPNSHFKYKIKRSELTLITRQLATLFAAKIPVEKSLQSVIEQTESKASKQILLAVRAKVLEGQSLSMALKCFPTSFPELYCATVHAGEQTGKLDVVLNQLADYSEQQQHMQQKVQQALIYPSIMIFISIAIVSFLLSFVVPKIISVFNSTEQTLPELTRYLIALSQFVQNYGLYALCSLFALAFAFKRSLKKEPIKERWHRLLLKIPLISFLIKTVNTTRYAHTLAILSSAGVPILNAMAVATKLVNSRPIRHQLNEAKKKVHEGATISQALKNTHYFSPMTIHLLSSGEGSGQLELMLLHAAKTQEIEVKRIIDTALTLFEPVIILFMGTVVLFIVLATLLPIFSMDQLIH